MYSVACLVATGIIFPLVGVFFVCLRFWVRLRFQPTYIGIDDIMIAIAAFLVCGFGALQATEAELGNLSPEVKPTPENSYITNKLNWVFVIEEKVAYGLIKLSILFFYRRIFGVNKRFLQFIWVMIVFVFCWAFAFLWQEVFLCGLDWSVQWKDHEEAPQKCINHGLSLVIFAGTDVLTDIIILVMPFFMIWKLKMSMREKFAVSGVFLLAFLAVVAGALRFSFITYSYTLGQTGWIPAPPPVPYPNLLKAILPIFWTLVELSAGVVAACLPPLGPLIRKTPKKVVSSIKNKISHPSTSSKSQDTFVSPHHRDSFHKPHAWDATTLTADERYSKDIEPSLHSEETAAPTIPRTSPNLGEFRVSTIWDDVNEPRYDPHTHEPHAL